MKNNLVLKAPFPWFGGKSRVGDLVWRHFGEVKNYVEPFFGSGAVLLGAPRISSRETVNDKDGFVANFWRATQSAPLEVAHHCNWPVNENDLHARHLYLVNQREDLSSRLEGDPDFFDAKIAGWWVWGICAWIGPGWCSEKGPWKANAEGRLLKIGKASPEKGVLRKLPDLGNAGRGVHRKLPVERWFTDLHNRLRRVRVCCGDWKRVVSYSVVETHGTSGVFLDPPYADTASRGPHIYAVDSLSVAHDVREWAIEKGNNPLIRIALCGYEGEHEMPSSWKKVDGRANRGYAKASNQNRRKERIWFSPGCLCHA
jgi:hypothetical protein